MTETRKLRVFLCHSSQDKPIVRELYQRLNAEGWIDPWLDEEKLIPGQDWDLEIEKAVEASDIVIMCLSKSSVTKEGYIQRELKFAMDIALEKPEGSIFVIPLRLDDCQVPRRLRSLQYIDYFPVNKKDLAYQRLLASFELRINTLKTDLNKSASPSNLAHFVAEEPPLSHFSSTYSYGDDDFDDSYSIDTKKGEFLGEFGIGISEIVSFGNPKKVIAFDVWLFDKNDVKTATTVLTNSYALSVPFIAEKIKAKGNAFKPVDKIVNAEQVRQLMLETKTLIMEVNVLDFQLTKNKITNVIFFNRLSADIKVWTK